MKTFYTIRETIQYLSSYKEQSIGFVPTMGFLHEGHLSLVKEARKENDLVVMSVFINPLQFGPNEDYEQYPRNEVEDEKQAKAAGVDVLFIPSAKEMYPTKQKLSLTFTEGADVLCGFSRPTHFSGVAVVLSKLFHIINPDKAYFGLKDAQQFALVHTLIEQLHFQLDLVGLPTIRETDGLAKSSRNVYLNDAERKEAPLLHQFLNEGRKFISEGMKDAREIEAKVRSLLSSQMPQAEVEYVTILNYPTLEETTQIKERIILAAAIKYRQARLIDNVLILPNGKKQDKITLVNKIKI